MPAAAGALNPPQSKTTKCRVALVPVGSGVRPTRATLTNSASAVTVTTEGTAQNVTMTLASDPGTLNMQVGQFLMFTDASGNKYLARVRTVFESGTSLALQISETIPAGATAEFPCLFRIRQSAGLSESVATTSFSSFDHTNSAVSIGEGTAQFAFDGGYSHYDPGLATCKYAKDNSLRLYVERELESPDSSVYSTGATDWAIAIVTAIDSPAADGDSVGGNVTFDISGTINRVEPAT